MKKRFRLSFVLAIALVVLSGSFSFAVEPTMNFSKDIKTITLEDAQKKMTTDSPSKELIEINKKQTQNKAQGHLESVQSYNEMLKDGGAFLGIKATTEIEKYLKKYAESVIQPNYEAEINKLNLDTLTNYYKYKQVEENEKIANENYLLKQTLLANTQKKLELGTVSKLEVMQAETAVFTARDELFKAQNDLKALKMSLNQYLGYDIMQSVALTDELKLVELPAKSLEVTINEALANRNEIRAASHGVNYAKLVLTAMDLYPAGSEKHLSAKTGLISAEKTYKDTVFGIEMDVRNKYIRLKEKYEAVTTGQKMLSNANESLRLSQLQYDLGLATLTSVNDAQIALNKAKLGLNANLLDYNLAVAEYNYASGVGTTTAPIN